MLKETIYSIIQWQKDTFPDETLEGQIAKFSEEEQEFDDSLARGKPDINELADMFIAACGVSRFDMLQCWLRLWRTLSTALDFKILWKDLCAAIDAKMAINRQRKWEKQDGMYKHQKD